MAKNKGPRIEEVQRLTCPKCGNNTKFRGENTKRKVVYQNFKFTDYKKMGGEAQNEERNVVNYSANFFAEGDAGFDIIYCAEKACQEKFGERIVVYRRHGAKSFEAMLDDEEVANRPNV
jgi:adenine-specific DNA methylase